MKSFVHLHVHSYYSLLDGMSSISALVDKAQKDGMPAIALTDHGSMFGIKEFYDFSITLIVKPKIHLVLFHKNNLLLKTFHSKTLFDSFFSFLLFTAICFNIIN